MSFTGKRKRPSGGRSWRAGRKRSRSGRAAAPLVAPEPGPGAGRGLHHRSKRYDSWFHVARSVIVSAVRTPFGKLGGASRRLPGDRARCDSRSGRRSTGSTSRTTRSSTRSWARCCRAAQARRPRGRRPSAPGLPIPLPADTINKVCASSIRAVEIADQMIRCRRPQRDRRGRDGVDVERAVRAPEGAVRLQARRRGADRPDGPRRPDVDASTASTWSSRRRSSRASSGSRARRRTSGRCARTSARSRRRTRAVRRRDRPGRRRRRRTRAHAATRRSRSSRR